MVDVIEQNKETYEKCYSFLDFFSYQVQFKKKTVKQILKKINIKEESTVLDIGFGSGDILSLFPKNAYLKGTEQSKNAVLRVKKHFPKGEFFLVEDERIPLPDNSVDLCTLSHIIEHVTNDEILLSEINRVLKVGGKAIALIPINEVIRDPRHVREYTISGFREMMEEKFNIQNWFENDYLSTWIDSRVSKSGRGKLDGVISYLFNLIFSRMPLVMLKRIEKNLSHRYKPQQLCIVAIKR